MGGMGGTHSLPPPPPSIKNLENSDVDQTPPGKSTAANSARSMVEAAFAGGGGKMKV